MNEKNLKNVFSSHDADKEEIRSNVLNGAKKAELKHFRLKPALAACVALLLLSGCFSVYAVAAEAKEYKAASEFFNEYSLPTEGLSRSDIKAVYRDISMKTYSYEKTIEIFNEFSIEINSCELGKADKESLDDLWNMRNTLIRGTQTPVQDGIIYKVDYINLNAGRDDIAPESRAVITKYKDDTELWRYTLPYDMYVFIGDNTIISDKGITVYGIRDNIGSETGYACAFTLDTDGKLIWEYTSDVLASDFDTAVRDGENTVLFGKSYRNIYSDVYGTIEKQYITGIFTVIDGNGNVIKNVTQQETDTFFRYDTAVVLGDKYLVKSFVRGENYEMTPELISVSRDGVRLDSFSYSEGGKEYFIQDIICHEGKVYLSSVLANGSDREFDNAFNSFTVEYIKSWEKNGEGVTMPESYNEKLTELFAKRYTAVLLVCDENAKVTKAYSVEDARAGSLSENESGQLCWQVMRIDGVKNVSPYISSRRVDILATEFSFIFDNTGAFIQKNEVGAYPMMY